jgi:hypothetical protein
MYPVVIVIIVFPHIGREAYSNGHERSNRLDLTIIDLSVGISTIESGQFPTSSSRGKVSTMSPSPV